MMMSRGGGFFAILFVLWAGWIVMATSNTARIERFCQPVLWTGNIATSITALTVSKYQDNVEEAFNSFDYGCRYSVWRLLFEESWIDEKEAEEQALPNDLETPQ